MIATPEPPPATEAVVRPSTQGLSEGYQAACACSLYPWAIGPWRSIWIDAAIDAWAHTTVKHPRPEPSWDDLLRGELTP